MITTEVKTDGLMTQLSEEVIESYDTGTDGKAVEDIIDDLLAFQRKATKITKGTISVIGTRTLKVDDRTIQAALLQLQESMGGYMYVDNNRALQWPTTIGEDKGQQIRFRKNLIGITRDIDYGGYCTKLHPVGGDEKLSDITLTKMLVDKSSADPYGYLTLKEMYACYGGWTGLGDALPAHVKVYGDDVESEVVWVSPTHHWDPGPCWANEAAAYDDNEASWAYNSPDIPAKTWTDWLHLAVSSFPGAGTITAIGVRIKFTGIGTAGIRLRIETSPDGVDYTSVTFVELSSADNDEWKEYVFAERTVWDARIKIYNKENYATWYKLNEFDFKTETGEENEVTEDWEQGADERTLRCAIGDYGEDVYRVSYDYANYLMAWDKIVDADDIVAKVVTNKYEAYAISLLEAAILLLDELKEIPITYMINAIDLSKNKDFNFDFEALQKGSIVTVIDEDLGINVSVRVVLLRKPDLLNPQNIELELSTRVKDISDYLADLHKEIG